MRAPSRTSVKDLIVAAAGVDDSQWESTYMKDIGGIITVRSELGGPIHKVNSRALKLWKECEDSVFKLPCEKCGAIKPQLRSSSRRSRPRKLMSTLTQQGPREIRAGLSLRSVVHSRPLWKWHWDLYMCVCKWLATSDACDQILVSHMTSN